MKRFEIALGLLLTASVTVAQSAGKPARPEYINAGRIPAFAEPLLQVLGGRLTEPGKERVQLTATLNDGKTSRPIQVVLELPLKGQIKDLGPGGGVLTVDGEDRLQSSRSPISDQEMDLIESLLLDRQEAVLYAMAQGDSVRLVGRGFPLVPGQGKNYRGPVYEIVDLHSKTEFRTEKPQRFRRCFFDSTTNLLHKVRYTQVREGRPMTVETFLREWVEVEGLRWPNIIERFENGQPVFTVRVVNRGVGAKLSDGVFGK